MNTLESGPRFNRRFPFQLGSHLGMILSQICPGLSLDLSGPMHSVTFPFQLVTLSGRILDGPHLLSN